MIASISLACPPMEIARVDRRHKRTAAEPMVATIRMPDGVVIVMPATIPETIVTKIRLWYWMVADCIGNGDTPEGRLEVHLPPEPTTWSWQDFTMVAQPIDCPTNLFLANGQTWLGAVTFPRCRISNLLGAVQVAEAVTALGTLTLQE